MNNPLYEQSFNLYSILNTHQPLRTSNATKNRNINTIITMIFISCLEVGNPCHTYLFIHNCSTFNSGTNKQFVGSLNAYLIKNYMKYENITKIGDYIGKMAWVTQN